MSDHDPREVGEPREYELRQTFLGLRPYVLIELHQYDDARLTLGGGTASEYLSMLRRSIRAVKVARRKQRREQKKARRAAR